MEAAAFTLVSASFLLGFSHAAGGKEAEVKEGKKALADDDISFHADSSFHEVPFREAVEFLKSRVPTLKPEWKKIERELQFRAFTMALLTREDLLEKARRHLTTVAEAGGGVKEFWSEARNRDWAEGLVAGYFETVFRTNVQTAYCAGRLMQYKNAKNEAYELLFMDDERTSETCRSLQSKCAGRAIAKADRFWEVVGYPPYHYNCRTTLRAVYREEKPERVSFTESELSHYREDVGDFGGDPIASGSFWKLTRGMAERAEKYGVMGEIVKRARELDMQSYFPELLQGYKTVYETKAGGYVETALNAKHNEEEMAHAEKLAKEGMKVYLLPEPNKIGRGGIKSPDMIINDALGDLKSCSGITSVDSRLRDACHQGVEIVSLDIKGDIDFVKVKKTCIDRLRRTGNKIKQILVFLNGEFYKIDSDSI